MKPDSRTIGEELLGAELVAGKELTEAAGSLFDALEKSGTILRDQTCWLVEDYARFWMSSLTRPADPSAIIGLIQNRSEHIASGMHDFGALVQKELLPLSKIWTDFLGVVMQDWRRS